MTTPFRTSPASPRADTLSARRVRDPYADLLRDTRSLRREQAAARDAWFAGLALDRKEEVLFELEMLLKGVVAWANPRNHPAPAEREPLSDRNFRPHLAVARAAVTRCLALAGMLLGSQRYARGVTRQLPSAFTEEGARHERHDAHPAETPEQALLALAQSLRVASVVLDGLLGNDRVPFRLFYAAVASVQREVARNPFFNPLFALEFRPEFDRVRAPDVLDAILSLDSEAAHRLVALTYLGAMRLLRVTSLLETTSLEPEGVPRAWALLAAVRSDARALSTVLHRRAAALLADSLERELMRVPAVDMRVRYEAVARDCERLRRLRAVMLATGASLRAEMRRVADGAVPSCDALVTPPEVAAAVQVTCARLRDALQGAVSQLTWALRGGADPERLFNDRHARRAVSERLRQSAWMFTVVTRAFVASARAARTDDLWGVGPSLGFVRDYLGYYRVLGEALAQETDHPRAEPLALALAQLRDADWGDGPRLAAAVEECEAFCAHLTGVIERMGQREELKGMPFDKAAAGETLRMYLGGG